MAHTLLNNHLVQTIDPHAAARSSTCSRQDTATSAHYINKCPSCCAFIRHGACSLSRLASRVSHRPHPTPLSACKRAHLSCEPRHRAAQASPHRSGPSMYRKAAWRAADKQAPQRCLHSWARLWRWHPPHRRWYHHWPALPMCASRHACKVRPPQPCAAPPCSPRHWKSQPSGSGEGGSPGPRTGSKGCANVSEDPAAPRACPSHACSPR
jgi:hypothetical protein